MPHPNVFRFEEHPEARVFPCTMPEAIAAMSRRHGIRVLTDWALFLLEHNGYDFNTVTAGKPTHAPFKYAETALYMFGVDTGFEFNDLDEVLKDGAALEDPYRRLLTPVGMCAGGNLLAQITAGNAGREQEFPGCISLQNRAVAASVSQLAFSPVMLRP
jgi:hypothetical protein